MRVLLSLMLAFVIAVAGTGIAKAMDPTIFGSCFEGGCGYAALFVALLGMLVLAPILWIALRRVGALGRLLLFFALFALIGPFILTTALWLLGLAALVYAMVRSIRRARADGHPIRAMLIAPRART